MLTCYIFDELSHLLSCVSGRHTQSRNKVQHNRSRYYSHPSVTDAFAVNDLRDLQSIDLARPKSSRISHIIWSNTPVNFECPTIIVNHSWVMTFSIWSHWLKPCCCSCACGVSRAGLSSRGPCAKCKWGPLYSRHSVVLTPTPRDPVSPLND